MRIAVYIDGFNLYYRRLRGTSYKWLNPHLLAQALTPGTDLAITRYFTAKIKPDPLDPQQQQRQQVYLRALDTLGPELAVHFGTFKIRRKQRRLVKNPKKTAYVYLPEEKGSDVNLATYLLLDASRDEFETALVVSNDTDLRQPIHIARRHFHKKVGIVVPGTRSTMPASSMTADHEVRISDAMLHKAQFPATFTDANGTIKKPPSW